MANDSHLNYVADFYPKLNKEALDKAIYEYTKEHYISMDHIIKVTKLLIAKKCSFMFK